jgi:2-polyprenyl-3-methyl-5-hydroxy-6-metoxy-1,4-benzoquinol methylase
MSLYPLDATRNAIINQALEPLLEDVREDVMSFPFSPDIGKAADVVEVYDQIRPRLNVLVSFLRDMVGSTGLDVSTGLGFLPVVLHRLGVHCLATERDLSICNFATKHGIDVRSLVIGHKHTPFPGQVFDFVVLGEVLEHLKMAPIRAVSEVTSALRPGGRFLLTTPNIGRLDHLQALMAGDNFLEPFHESVPPGSDPTDYIEHVREYSVREVVEAVEGAGLTVDSVVMTGWGSAGYNPLPNPHVNEICVVRATK